MPSLSNATSLFSGFLEDLLLHLCWEPAHRKAAPKLRALEGWRGEEKGERVLEVAAVTWEEVAKGWAKGVIVEEAVRGWEVEVMEEEAGEGEGDGWEVEVMEAGEGEGWEVAVMEEEVVRGWEVAEIWEAAVKRGSPFASGGCR